MGMVDPLAVAEVLVLANAAGDHRTGSEIGKNEGKVTGPRHDWIRLVGGALPVMAGVDMRVCDDAGRDGRQISQKRQLLPLKWTIPLSRACGSMSS